jgi:hypothetical protein
MNVSVVRRRGPVIGDSDNETYRVPQNGSNRVRQNVIPLPHPTGPGPEVIPCTLPDCPVCSKGYSSSAALNRWNHPPPLPPKCLESKRPRPGRGIVGTRLPRTDKGDAARERPSNQVSNNRRRQQRTPADADGRSRPGKACRSAGSLQRDLASGRRGRRFKSVHPDPGHRRLTILVGGFTHNSHAIGATSLGPPPMMRLAGSSVQIRKNDQVTGESSGSRAPRRRSRFRQAGVLATVLSSFALLAACGGSPASLSATHTGSQKSKLLAFSSCIRAHGISDFPDPQPGGGYAAGQRLPPRARRR